MVDFNNEATVGTPATDIMRVLVIEERKYLLDAIENYYKHLYLNSDPDNSIIKSRLQTLYLELYGSIQRHLEPELIKELETNIESHEFKDNLEATKTFILLLDKFKITRLDTKRIYDSTRPAEEDEEKNL